MPMTVLACLFSLVLLLCFPEHCSSCAREALKVWGMDVVPSLFPYMVFCRLLSETLRAKRVPAVWAVPVLGLLGGSPSGAAVIGCYADELSRRQILAMYALTGAVSPMFLIGSVGRWLHSPKTGVLLACTQVIGSLASFLAALFYLPVSEQQQGKKRLDTLPRLNAIRESISALFSVGGYIVVFSVISGMMDLIPFLCDEFRTLVHVVLEVAGGMHNLSVSDLPLKMKTVVLSAASSFGGFSILFQNLFFLRPVGIDPRDLLPIAAIRSACSAAAMLLLYSIMIL